MKAAIRDQGMLEVDHCFQLAPWLYVTPDA
jgi:hypothetical protein